MAARPSTAPTWATTTNYATSNDPAAVGQPTKEDPSSISAQGWDFVQRPRPTYFNFWQNAVGVWLSWAKNNAFGADGGTYTLDDYLALGTHGLTIWDSGELTVTDDSFFFLNGAGSFTPTSSVTVDGAWTFEGTNPVFHNGATFSTAGDVSTTADVTVSIGGRLGFFSSGHMAHIRQVAASDADQTIAATTRYFELPTGVFSGPHKGIMSAGLTAGQVRTVTSFDATNVLNIYQADGTTTIKDTRGNDLKVIGTPSIAGDYFSVELIWNGSLWRFVTGGSQY